MVNPRNIAGERRRRRRKLPERWKSQGVVSHRSRGLLLRSMWWLRWLDPLSPVSAAYLGVRNKSSADPQSLVFEGHTSGPYLLPCLAVEWAGLQENVRGKYGGIEVLTDHMHGVVTSKAKLHLFVWLVSLAGWLVVFCLVSLLFC